MIKNSLKILSIIILSLILLLLTGCSDTSLNIENYYYIVAIGIDKTDTTNILLNIQIAESSESEDDSGSSQSSSSEIYSVEASSINSGINILNNHLSKKLNFSHCSAIIFSEDIAKDGIKKYINTLSNNLELRPTCHIIISNTSASEVLECISNSKEKFSAKLYDSIINSVDYTGYSINPELEDIFYNLNDENSSAIATYVNIYDDTFQSMGIALFDGEKFITHLSALDSIAYSIVTDKLNSCTITINDPFELNEKIDILVNNQKDSKINVNIINGHPYIDISNNLDYSIESSSTDLTYNSNENLKILKEHIDTYLEEIILNFLYKISHEYNQDICNFNNNVSSNYLTYNEFEKINWNEIYKDSYFNIDIKGNIINSGLFNKK